MNDTAKNTGATAASATIDRAKETISRTAQRAGDQVASSLDKQKDRAADGLCNFADALRQSSDQLRQDDEANPVPDYVVTAASQVERLSEYLRSTNSRQLVGNVERFAREQPALFISSAFVLGLLGARFLKSSGTGSSHSEPDFRTSSGRDGDLQSEVVGSGSYSSGYSSRV